MLLLLLMMMLMMMMTMMMMMMIMIMMMIMATPIVAMFSTLLRLMVSFELSLAFFCFNGHPKLSTSGDLC